MSLTLWVSGQPVPLLGVLVLGVVVGYLAGMFGVGGGFLLTPLLSVVFRVPLPVAVGTGLCQMIGTALVALLRHRRLRQGEIRFDLLMLAGSLVGVDAGARVLVRLAAAGSVSLGGRHVPLLDLVVQASYVALLLAAAALFWRQGRGLAAALDRPEAGPLSRIRLGPRIDLPRVPLYGVSAVFIAQIGLGLGFLGGLLGIGGGVALMPVLVYGFGFPLRQAAGTGIVVVLATAVTGTFVHAVRGHVDLTLASALLVGSTVSAQLGARATRRLSPRMLRRAFALVILATVAAIVWSFATRGA